MRQIQTEWKWEAHEAERGIWMREFLVWRGIVLAVVEGSDDRWFGNLGNGASIEDWESRVAHQRSRTDARNKLETTLLKRLDDGLKNV